MRFKLSPKSPNGSELAVVDGVALDEVCSLLRLTGLPLPSTGNCVEGGGGRMNGCIVVVVPLLPPRLNGCVDIVVIDDCVVDAVPIEKFESVGRELVAMGCDCRAGV